MARSLVVLVGGWSPLSSYLRAGVLIIVPLGLRRVVQLWWIQSLDDWRFLSSAKKDGIVVQRVVLKRCVRGGVCGG